MRKILFGVIGCFTVFCAHAAQIVNVDYIHKLIAQEWDISIPIKADSPMHVANMKYLLTAVDVANEILNGEKTTDYGNGEFATLQIADTVATNQAVDTLIQKPIEYKFFLTTTSTNSFSFSISAAGKFYVDWGDGKRQTITKANTTNTTYSHNYSTRKSYTIKLAGQATAYASTAAISFYVGSNTSAKETNVKKIASIDGSLGAIFGTLSSDTNNQPIFSETFSGASNMTGSIPANLFTGIFGAPAATMFYRTFYGCSGLTGAIPAGLFGNLYGAPAMFMFGSTFSGCSGLTGAIPDGLFAGISGAPAYGMFSSTFSGCSGLTSIPENLFGNISGKIESTSSPFTRMFNGCVNLTGPSAKINGKYIYEIWPETDQWRNGLMYTNCKKLSDYMYIPTIYGGMGITDIEYVSAPDNVDYKFFVTTIPDVDLFAISIAAAGDFYIDWGDGAKQKITKNDTEKYNIGHKYANSGQYTIGIGGQATAYNTNSRESTIKISYYIRASESYTLDGDGPLNYIASIDGSLGAIFGTLADGSQPRFYQTFYEATNMTGSIPSDLFAGISGAPATYMFYQTFDNCTSLTGPSARINGQYLYEIWPSATSSQVSNMYYNATGLSDYRCIPTVWGGGGEDCSAPTAEFTLTTTDDTDSFRFNISAAGEFVVDWGDGTVETITKTHTANTPYSHNYDTANTYTIGLSGQATAYNTDESTAAISFYVDYNTTNVKKIASIDGSLGAIFGTLADGTQPIFYNTFNNATNMTGSIPSDLFAGISGAPADYMFRETFSGCSGLTGAIPDGLFAGISGAPADSMFGYTFYGCSGLTSIPEKLFGNISGTAHDNMFVSMFDSCTSLTGPSARINGQYLYEIWPELGFGNVRGPYYGCTGLSDYSTMPAVWRSYND